MSKHIRYVSIWLGNGGYVPHEATKILEMRYGDCKDHAVVFEALLKAKGIASAPVLINSGNRYRLPEAATPAAFNHVFTYLPELDLYADSTIGVAPLGTLAADEYGKLVAVAIDTGAGRRALPLVAAEANEETLQTTAELLADGTVEGESETTASGPFAVTLRHLAAFVEAHGREEFAATELRKLGLAGTGSFDFAAPRDRLAPPLRGDRKLPDRPATGAARRQTVWSPHRVAAARSARRISAWLVDPAENGADTLFLGPSGRGAVLDPAAGTEHHLAPRRQQLCKFLSAVSVGVEPRSPNRTSAPRDRGKAAGCGVPRRNQGPARRADCRDPRRLPQHDRLAADCPLKADAA